MSTSSSTMTLQARTRLSYQLERLKMATEHAVLGSLPRLAESDLTPFAIVFQARTGSNMVRTALNGHPNVRCYREIFRDRERTANGHGPVGVPSPALSSLLETPNLFLDDYLFGPQRKGVKAVGFKLAYGHAREDEWLGVWQYLAKKNTHIVELRRHDSLAVLCSIERARSTGAFVRYASSTPVSQEPIQISTARCEAFFQGTARRQREADQLLSDNPRLILYYEDLTRDWQGHTNKIQDFLGVTRQAVTPSTARQSTLPTSEAIANFDELRSHFEATDFAGHFEKVS